MGRTQPTKKQKLVDFDKYKAFLVGGTSQKEASSNPLNIFDDSNKKDRVLMISARGYLNKKDRLAK